MCKNIEKIIKLKPCPFCGGEAYNDYRSEDRKLKDGTLLTRSERFRISCRSCGGNTGWAYYEDDAIEAWNRRTYDGRT